MSHRWMQRLTRFIPILSFYSWLWFSVILRKYVYILKYIYIAIRNLLIHSTFTRSACHLRAWWDRTNVSLTQSTATKSPQGPYEPLPAQSAWGWNLLCSWSFLPSRWAPNPQPLLRQLRVRPGDAWSSFQAKIHHRLPFWCGFVQALFQSSVRVYGRKPLAETWLACGL